MAVQVRKVVGFKENLGEFEEQLVCPFCNATYDVTIDPSSQTVTFDLAPEETFCEHFDPSDCEWVEGAVAFYFNK